MDLIGSSLTLSLPRSGGVDYLLPIGRSYNALFIKNDLASKTAFNLYLQPLRVPAWTALAVAAAISAILILALKTYRRRWSGSTRRGRRRRRGADAGEVAVDLAGTYWMSLASNFGWAPREDEGRSPHGRGGGGGGGGDAFRVFVVLMLFSGNVVFMAYNASLTVALSIVRPRLPFRSLEGLLKSEYRLELLRNR